MLHEEEFSSDSSDDDYIPTGNLLLYSKWIYTCSIISYFLHFLKGAESDVEELTDEAEQISNSESDDMKELNSSKRKKLPLKKKKLKK